MRPKDFRHLAARVGAASREVSQQQSAHLRSVQAQIDALTHGDVAEVLRDAHGDVQLEIFAPPQFAFVSRAQGKDEVQRAITHNFDSVDEQQTEIVNVMAEGDVVVLIGRERGRIRATGENYEVQFVHRFTFREGRLVAVRIVAANTTADSESTESG